MPIGKRLTHMLHVLLNWPLEFCLFLIPFFLKTKDGIGQFSLLLFGFLLMGSKEDICDSFMDIFSSFSSALYLNIYIYIWFLAETWLFGGVFHYSLIGWHKEAFPSVVLLLSEYVMTFKHLACIWFICGKKRLFQ